MGEQEQPTAEQLPAPDQQAAPRYTFNLYRYNNLVQGQWVGGAPDLLSCCSLAAAWLSAAQQIYPTKQVGIGVVDSTLTMVAYVGWQPPP